MKLEPKILREVSQYKCGDGDSVTLSELGNTFIVEYYYFDNAYTCTTYYDNYDEALNEFFKATEYWNTVWEDRQRVEEKV